MKTPIQSIVVVISLVSLIGSCTVQDHLRPAANPYENCLLVESKDVEVKRLEAGSELQIGDPFPNSYSNDKVTDIIEVDGQKYALATFGETADYYKYDAQKRVIEHAHTNRLFRGAQVYSYSYDANKLTRKYEQEGFPSQTGTITYTLNEFGLIQANDVVYDEQGYVIQDKDGRKFTITNGNISKSENGGSVVVFEYDLTKFNLPNPLPFLGKTDRNLLMKVQSATADPTSLPLVEYRYQFDDQGKVIRKVSISRLPPYNLVKAQAYRYDCE